MSTCLGNGYTVCYFIISDFSQIVRLYINLKLYLFLVAYLPDGGLVQDAVMGNFLPN